MPIYSGKNPSLQGVAVEVAADIPQLWDIYYRGRLVFRDLTSKQTEQVLGEIANGQRLLLSVEP